MKTVGPILKEARLRKKLTLADVEKSIKIRAKFLEDIENDTYGALPSLSYAKGFVKNYSDFLGLRTADIMAFFRRQTQEAPKSSLLPKGVADPLTRSAFRLTPGRFFGLLLAGLLGIFLLYFGLQYRKIQLPPALRIEQPSEMEVVKERRIDVTGATDSDATIVINGVSVMVRSDGKFFDQVTLEEGINTITVMATSRFGKTSTEVRRVELKIE